VIETTTDPGILRRVFDDEPMHLREWGTNTIYALPPLGDGTWSIGSAEGTWLRIQDRERFVSRHHAVLKRDLNSWIVIDTASKNGLWLDGERVTACELSPGAEIGLGRLRLVVDTPRFIRLRSLLQRWLGWRDEQRAIIDRGLRAIRNFATGRSPLLLVAPGNVIALAQHVHREVLGRERPFLLSDPRRRRASPGPRVVENYGTSTRGHRAASGGTLCVWSEHLPEDFATTRERIDDPANRTRLIICAHTVEQLRTPPGGAINVPPLHARPNDLDRVMREYAQDAIVQLRAKASAFTKQDHDWLIEQRPETLDEIERATLRLVALQEFGGVTRASEQLGISHGALSRWRGRRLPRAKRGTK
jgi:hypothetical protein